MNDRMRNLLHQVEHQGLIGKGKELSGFTRSQTRPDLRFTHFGYNTALFLYFPTNNEHSIVVGGPSQWANQLVAVGLTSANQPSLDKLLIVMMQEAANNDPLSGALYDTRGSARVNQIPNDITVLPPLQPIPWELLREDESLKEAFRESLPSQLGSQTARSWRDFLRKRGDQLPFGIWNELGHRILKAGITINESPKRPPLRLILS